MRLRLPFLLMLGSVILLIDSLYAQDDAIDYVAALYSNTMVRGDIEFANINGKSLKLDAYIPVKRLGEGPDWVDISAERKPTLLFLHGGGWDSGNKISRSLFLMPYVSKGWAVVTADYRLIDETNLLGCIGDSRLALNWVYEHADQYSFDTNRIVVSGESAGGHLSLMTGFLTDDAPFLSKGTSINHELKVAAIINLFGGADLTDYSRWSDERKTLIAGRLSDIERVTNLASPILYLRDGVPPVMTVKGDLDKGAHEQGIKLHKKMEEMGLENYLLNIPGKKHGNFTPQEMTMMMKEIWQFLGQYMELPN